MSDKKNSFKLVMLGKARVGKTSIINRYVEESFDENYVATPGMRFASKEIKIPEKGITFKLDCWDTSGIEKYRPLSKFFCKDADIIILVYSVTDWNSFEELKECWYQEIAKSCPKNSIIGIVGNKCDLFKEEKVSEEEGRAFAKEINAFFQLTSPAEDIGIEELFKEIIDKCIQLKTNSNETQK